jgi:hypothetical protein
MPTSKTARAAVTASAFICGAVIGTLPFAELLFLRPPVSPSQPAVVITIASLIALLLTVPYRARAAWLTGLAVGLVGAAALFGGDWRNTIYVLIYITGTWLISLPIAAAVALGLVIGLEIERRRDARAATSRQP